MSPQKRAFCVIAGIFLLLLAGPLWEDFRAWAAEPTVDQTRTLTVRVHAVEWAGTDLRIVVGYRASDNTEIRRRTITVRSTRAALDDLGQPLGNAPAALLTNAASFKTSIEALVSTAIAAGKLQP